MTFLKVTDLAVNFTANKKTVRPINGVSFEMKAGEVLGVVGETGSGKSLTAQSIMGLTPLVGGRVSGSIQFGDKDLLTISSDEMQSIRGAEISYIPQNPMTSLDPVFRVGDQIVEGIRTHRKISKKDAKLQTLDILEKLRIPSPGQVYMQYPHQLSGGLKQRIVIAIGLVTNPKLLIADEPTTALDVTVQAQIMRLFKEHIIVEGISLLLITHDLGVLAQVCDKVAVMYAGNIVEYGDIGVIFGSPKHPYTQALLACIPFMGMKKGSLAAISGNVPNAGNYPEGCRFHPRCLHFKPQCKTDVPPMKDVPGGTRTACHIYE